MTITVDNIKALKIKLISPDIITEEIAKGRQISSTEMFVKRSNGANIKYDPNGLFAEEKFGSFDNIKNTNKLGYIQLAVPVAHIWFFKNQKKLLSIITGLSQANLEEVLYYNKYLIFSRNEHGVEYTTVAIQDYLVQNAASKEALDAEIGGRAICRLLALQSIPQRIEELKLRLAQTNAKTKRQKIIKELNILIPLAASGNKPEDLMLKIIPVLPLRMRRLKKNYDGTMECAHLNTLYKRILEINTRITTLELENAPLLLQFLEKRALQEAVDALIHFSKRGNEKHYLSENDQDEALTQRLATKKGHFRDKLLAKRVDFSGRSVITVGPDLQLNQCGIPRKIALELFWPFIYALLKEKGYIKRSIDGKDHDIKLLQSMLSQQEQTPAEAWLYSRSLELLQELMQRKVILLNRAPSLHRHSIMAFYPVLNADNCDAIRLHPLVCSPFNADFDGDTMAVHLPLSDEAQAEALRLMSVTNSLISSSNGSPLISLSQDAILGAYYYTYIEDKPVYERIFISIQEAMLAYETREISLQEPIKVRIANSILSHSPRLTSEAKEFLQNHLKQEGNVITSIGTLLFFTALASLNSDKNKEPYFYDEKHLALVPFKALEEDPPNTYRLCTLLTKKKLRKLILAVFTVYGPEYTQLFLDRIKDYAYHTACTSGLSISAFDVDMPDKMQEKIKLKAEEKNIASLADQEKIKKWTEISDELFEEAKAKAQPMNPLHRMIASGARGDENNYRQVIAMRGIMNDTSGRPMVEPIKSNFTEGLTSGEYFTSSSGARLGLIDTALHTAEPGYFARILVYAAHNVIVTEEDCCKAVLEANTNAIPYQDLKAIVSQDLNGAVNTIQSLESRVTGRYLAEPIKEYPVDTFITPQIAKEITDGRSSIRTRSPISCRCRHGICRKCYGMDLATYRLIKLGTPIGIIAAQTISEKGTQLNLKSFHSGGIASDDEAIAKGISYIKKIFNAVKSKTTDVKALEKVKTTDFKNLIKHLQTEKHLDIRTAIQAIAELITYKVLEAYYKSNIDDIDAKIVEIIVRQMLQKGIITDSGDSLHCIDELVNLLDLEQENQKLLSLGKKPIVYQATVQGITELARDNESFLASAAFGYLSASLTKASLTGQEDKLQGIIENAILGKRIPAGD